MKIIISGYTEEFSKVQFNKYLRANHGHNIKSARDCVDLILSGKPVDLFFEDENLAEKELQYQGVKFKVTK